MKLEQASDPEEVLARLIAVEEQRKAAEGAEAQQTEQEAQAEAQAEEAPTAAELALPTSPLASRISTPSAAMEHASARSRICRSASPNVWITWSQ